MALLILSRTACAQDPFGLLREARSGLAKVIQSLPGDLRGRIAISSELIADDALALELAPDRQAIRETILAGLDATKATLVVASRTRMRFDSRDETQFVSSGANQEPMVFGRAFLDRPVESAYLRRRGSIASN